MPMHMIPVITIIQFTSLPLPATPKEPVTINSNLDRSKNTIKLNKII